MQNQQAVKPQPQPNDLDQLQQYYKLLPYPLRDPEEERTRLIPTIGEHLAELNHWLYRGKENFRSNFRILVAGGGTGDSSTFLGEQLKDTNAEIVYLDFSNTSMEIARKRAEIRGLKNITWICDSILNIPKLNLGKFDFINCIGVLHHFPDPVEALRILKDALTENGGVNFLVYAKYGRIAVGHLQQIMKMINIGTTNMYKALTHAKALMQSLPPENWFMKSPDLIQDHMMCGDTGLHGMLLQPDDHTFSIPEIYKLASDAGLHVVDFIEPRDRLLLKIESYISDVDLLNRIKKMDIVTQRAICELMLGNMIRHAVYLSNQPQSIATTLDLNNTPFLFQAQAGVAQYIHDHCATKPINAILPIPFDFTWAKGLTVRIYNGQYTQYIFKYLDGIRSLQEIFDAIRTELAQEIQDEVLMRTAQKALAPLSDVGLVLLRDKSIS